mmetsp:Transcript_50478/g.152021  ORF Transcript_50478/g.152021 Transcript_50478/m.152021 type:complete len:210 (-) Transcript_50478:59-688(-)
MHRPQRPQERPPMLLHVRAVRAQQFQAPPQIKFHVDRIGHLRRAELEEPFEGLAVSGAPGGIANGFVGRILHDVPYQSGLVQMEAHAQRHAPFPLSQFRLYRRGGDGFGQGDGIEDHIVVEGIDVETFPGDGRPFSSRGRECDRGGEDLDAGGAGAVVSPLGSREASAGEVGLVVGAVAIVEGSAFSQVLGVELGRTRTSNSWGGGERV